MKKSSSPILFSKSVLVCDVEQEDRKGYIHSRSTFKKSLDKAHTKNQHQNGSIQRLHNQHLAVRQRCLRRILGISWQDKVPNTEILSRANLPRMFTMLRQRTLCWLRPVRRMDDGRIPKDILYGELRTGKLSTGHPQLRFKDVVKRDMKALDIDVRSWEDLAADRPRWRSTQTDQVRGTKACACSRKRGQRKQRLTPKDQKPFTYVTLAEKNVSPVQDFSATNVAVRERQNRIQYPMVVCDRWRPTKSVITLQIKVVMYRLIISTITQKTYSLPL